MSSPTSPHDGRGRPWREYLGTLALVALVMIGALLFMQGPTPR